MDYSPLLGARFPGILDVRASLTESLQNVQRPRGKALKKILPQDLVPMDEFCAGLPVRVRPAYARSDNLLFDERIYKVDARLWLYRDLAMLVREAAVICHNNHGLIYVLHDGLRTIEAQQRMLETARVRANPSWLAPPNPLLSSPGQGGHPRGMAIDISLETEDGRNIDMGTAFDFLSTDSSPAHNPAHRAHPHLSADVIAHRAALDDSMKMAAEKFNLPLLPLPEEWWDFRFPKNYFGEYAPLSESDLPPHMRLLD